MNEFNDFFSFIVAFAFLALLLLVFTVGIFLVVPLGIAIAVGLILYAYLSPNSPRNRAKAEVAEIHALYASAKDMAAPERWQFEEFLDEVFSSEQIKSVALQLFDLEGYQRPGPPPPVLTGIEGGRYRDELQQFLNRSHHWQNFENFMVELHAVLSPFDDAATAANFFQASKLLSPEEVDQLAQSFFADHQHFKYVQDTLEQNLQEQNMVFPPDYKGDNCTFDYLKNTPLLELEYKAIPAEWKNRASHTLILAGSGAGKTTLFKHMIAKLLEEDCCVIVMDSQTQLIEELAGIDVDLDDITWVSPEHKLALNPLKADPAELEDEAAINNRVSLLKFVVEHLIKAEMTSKQDTLFHHCCQLVFSIPNANVETFQDILRQPGDFTEYIDKLEPNSKKFFTSELHRTTSGKKRGVYDSTREELSYRLDGLTRQFTFRRIFGAIDNNFNLYDEMLNKQLVLIDTNQGLLSDDSPTFGRYFVAQALQACFKRVRNKKIKRPVYFFIDEAHEVFDEKLERMLLQARKANVGLILATQDFARASKAGITDTLIGSTATKIVSQVGSGDAKQLAPRMQCEAQYMTSLPEHVFAFSSGSQPVVSIRAAANPLGNKMEGNDLQVLKNKMEELYGPAEKLSAEVQDEEQDPVDEPEEQVDEIAPSPSLKSE